MGTGKSTVGRLVAAQTGAAFVDLDQAVEQAAGMGVAQIFREHGEGAFRQRERDELARVLAGATTPTVVALGGGTLCHPPLLERALGQAFVVTLTATPEIIAERARSGDRPLLDDEDPARAIRRLLKRRARAYASTHLQLPSDRDTPEQLASCIAALWQRGRPD
jgi:shikimate kinase